MTTQKQPQAGEWWQQQDGTRYLCIATNQRGETIWQVKDGGFRSLIGDHNWKHWQHLPDCTGWDWQPEVWPKWYVPTQSPRMSGCVKYIAYYRCDTKNGGITVHTDGSQFTWEDWDNPDMKKEVTEAEALARVTPQESPDDWVTQDHMPDRPEIDEWRWVGPNHTSSWYKSVRNQQPYHRHGYKDEDSVFEVRCRRKDLPPLASPVEHPSNQQLFEMVANLRDQMDAMSKRKESPLPSPKCVPVRLLCSTEDVGSVIWRMSDDPGYAGETEIKHDANGFYVEVQP